MISFGLGQRLALLITLTIPVFELTVVEWVTVQQAAKAADAQEAVLRTRREHGDEGLRGGDRRGAIPQIAQTIQTPSLSPETISLVAQSISDQLTGITNAVQYGIEARKGVDNAIMQASTLMSNAADQESGKILQLVAESSAPQPPPPPALLTALPQAVVQQAPELLAS